MWNDLDTAATALRRDGWTRDTAYWWRKRVGDDDVWLELEWRGKGLERRLFPIERGFLED